MTGWMILLLWGASSLGAVDEPQNFVSPAIAAPVKPASTELSASAPNISVSAPVTPVKTISNKASLIEASPIISTLEIQNKMPVVVPNFSTSPPVLEIEFQASFKVPDWSLVYQAEPLEIKDEQVKTRFPIRQKVQELEFIGVGPYGEVEQMTMGVVVENFDELMQMALEEEKQRTVRRKRRLLGASSRLGFSQAKVFGSTISDESTLELYGQLSVNYRLGNSGLSEHFSLANITKIYGPQEGFLRSDLRVVYAFFDVDAPWQLYGNVGAYFSRVLKSNSQINLSTIQLEMYPSFRANLPSSWGKGAMLLGLVRYFPVSPSTTPSGEGSEIELDLEYLLSEGVIFKKKRVSVGLNYYYLRAVKSGQEAGFQAVTLFTGIRF